MSILKILRFEWELRRTFRFIWAIFILPFELLAELFGIEIGRGKQEKMEKLPLKTRLMSLPDNLMMAGKSAWRSRERVLSLIHI